MAASMADGSWYRDGNQLVVVLTGLPEQAVQIGTGPTPARAWASLEATPIQSAGRPGEAEQTALRWAHGAGWISDPDDLVDADAEVA